MVVPISYQEFLELYWCRRPHSYQHEPKDAPIYRDIFRILAEHNHIELKGELPQESDVLIRLSTLERRVASLESKPLDLTSKGTAASDAS